jgi:glycine/D-amino acid oxidase-like deaminating enzyme
MRSSSGPDPGAHERLQAACERISPLLTAERVVARPACIRPATPDGLPVIGALQGVEGGYVASGHGVWGMLNAPATGEAIAELVVDGVARSTELEPFDPARFHRWTLRCCAPGPRPHRRSARPVVCAADGVPSTKVFSP